MPRVNVVEEETHVVGIDGTRYDEDRFSRLVFSPLPGVGSEGPVRNGTATHSWHHTKMSMKDVSANGKIVLAL